MARPKNNTYIRAVLGTTGAEADARHVATGLVGTGYVSKAFTPSWASASPSSVEIGYAVSQDGSLIARVVRLDEFGNEAVIDGAHPRATHVRFYNGLSPTSEIILEVPIPGTFTFGAVGDFANTGGIDFDPSLNLWLRGYTTGTTNSNTNTRLAKLTDIGDTPHTNTWTQTPVLTGPTNIGSLKHLDASNGTILLSFGANANPASPNIGGSVWKVNTTTGALTQAWNPQTTLQDFDPGYGCINVTVSRASVGNINLANPGTTTAEWGSSGFPPTNSLVLIRNQTVASQNGIYVSQGPHNSLIGHRWAGANTASTVMNLLVTVPNGVVFGNRQYYETQVIGTLNVSGAGSGGAVGFAQLSSSSFDAAITTRVPGGALGVVGTADGGLIAGFTPSIAGGPTSRDPTAYYAGIYKVNALGQITARLTVAPTMPCGSQVTGTMPVSLLAKDIAGDLHYVPGSHVGDAGHIVNHINTTGQLRSSYDAYTVTGGFTGTVLNLGESFPRRGPLLGKKLGGWRINRVGYGTESGGYH